jgi:hypothetical protein
LKAKLATTVPAPELVSVRKAFLRMLDLLESEQVPLGLAGFSEQPEQVMGELRRRQSS